MISEADQSAPQYETSDSGLPAVQESLSTATDQPTATPNINDMSGQHTQSETNASKNEIPNVQNLETLKPVEIPPGAPFPMRLVVAHRWDIGVKFYEHLKFLIDWIDERIKDPEETGEEFMRGGGSSMKFGSIWQDFFLRMVESESNGIIERLQYGLKVKKQADRVHQCLHFEYGRVRELRSTF